MLRRALLAFAASLVGGACVPVYIAPVANVPLLSGRGEFQVAAYSGTNGLDLQGAVAVAEHVGIVADISNNRRTDSNDFHTYGELGAGYFGRIGQLGRVELYGGAGAGESAAETTWLGETIRAQGMYYRGFGQANIGLTTDIVDVGFCARVAYVGYTFDQRSGDGPTSASELFIEPVGFFRVGYRWVKLGVQAGLTIPVLGEELTVDTFPLLVTMGLHTRFNGLE
jgi:hypothetical protein